MFLMLSPLKSSALVTVRERKLLNRLLMQPMLVCLQNSKIVQSLWSQQLYFYWFLWSQPVTFLIWATQWNCFQNGINIYISGIFALLNTQIFMLPESSGQWVKRGAHEQNKRLVFQHTEKIRYQLDCVHFVSWCLTAPRDVHDHCMKMEVKEDSFRNSKLYFLSALTSLVLH